MCFQETDIKNLELNDVNLYKSEIIKTSLKDIDISTCKIDNIIIDSESTKGLIIDRYQSIDLIGMLGVKIKD